MKVLLICPEFPDTCRSFKHALEFEAKRSVFPFLSLLTISVMPASNEWQRLIDANVEPLQMRYREQRAAQLWLYDK